jgi:hypothetical protein
MTSGSNQPKFTKVYVIFVVLHSKVTLKFCFKFREIFLSLYQSMLEASISFLLQYPTFIRVSLQLEDVMDFETIGISGIANGQSCCQHNCCSALLPENELLPLGKGVLLQSTRRRKKQQTLCVLQ